MVKGQQVYGLYLCALFADLCRMSDRKDPANDDVVKKNARLNIIQALGNLQTASPPATPPLVPHNQQAEVSVDILAQERQAHIFGVVNKTLQMDNTGSSTPTPPLPRPRSPRQSPSNRYTCFLT